MKKKMKEFEEASKKADEQKKEDEAEKEALKKEIYSTKVSIQEQITSSKVGDKDAGGVEARAQGWGWMINSLETNTEDYKAMLEALWMKYDADKSGTLEKSEIKLILSDVAAAKKKKLEKKMPKILKRLKEPDPLGINKAMLPGVEAEFEKNLALYSKREAGEIQDEELNDIFSKMDAGVEGEGESDGKITKEEFCSHASDIVLAEEKARKKQEEAAEVERKKFEEEMAKMFAEDDSDFEPPKQQSMA
jgi:hypothetical protein